MSALECWNAQKLDEILIQEKLHVLGDLHSELVHFIAFFQQALQAFAV